MRKVMPAAPSRSLQRPSVIVDETTGDVIIDVVATGYIQIVITADGDVLCDGESILVEPLECD
ncbi:hypothetical protein GCM10007874_61360 [Labrys miyagiensis]|uniref:Uncharacterized protein n=1 Tax=Labrys miyagiensis TaxID=346912 RepID=A0ABQ6CRY5_9HYPH|nr:hypothetical protein [Labrys miyagiensis]GLS23116.1 hypothetical protein GCM10007874_61360 [Labrys miyagiensis]